jgi:hypothetical protein
MGCVSSSPEKPEIAAKYIDGGIDTPSSKRDQQKEQEQNPVTTNVPAEIEQKKADPSPVISVHGTDIVTEPTKAEAGANTETQIGVPVSKLRTDCKIRDVYQLGKVLGTGGECASINILQIDWLILISASGFVQCARVLDCEAGR